MKPSLRTIALSAFALLASISNVSAVSIQWNGNFSGNTTTKSGLNDNITFGLGTDITEIKVDASSGINGGLTVDSSGSWSYMGSLSPTSTVVGFALKGGPQFALYSVLDHAPGSNISSLPWSMTGIPGTDGEATPSPLTVGKRRSTPALSHFSLFVANRPSVGVPDGGTTFLLLGGSLLGIGLIRRFVSRMA